MPLSSSPDPSHSVAPPAQRAGRVWRVARLLILLAVLGVAFVGHLSPAMKLQWENLMALCGF